MLSSSVGETMVQWREDGFNEERGIRIFLVLDSACSYSYSSSFYSYSSSFYSYSSSFYSPLLLLPLMCLSTLLFLAISPCIVSPPYCGRRYLWEEGGDCVPCVGTSI